ncbi:Do family serine endopeptidase [Sphingobacterium wenxiniae]|uniref:Do/DeqQ family serine protease n=1 Tax=Sphingobacterium wenxiniae TaxID=683125 RepID=A0A1I6UNW6_9SPHI|nr:Do family serine endopeptidase [Sphingobacterium wenxiniae]SFT03142.1 Do/DeqQ family serine protease [Sphingobacterium wenxiniae]
MKKIGITLLTALVGGSVAIGGYKIFEKKQSDSMTFEEKQKVYYANNPASEMISSTGNPDFTEAAAAVMPGVVHIKVTVTTKGSQRGSSPFDMFEEFFGMPQQRRSQPRQQQGSGSGVIISPDGYIVTNNHVVADADKITVELTDRRTLEAKVIGRDPDFDLALIKVNADKLPFVRFGNSDNLRIGEWVLAVGYPLGLQSTVTAGIVSAKGRELGLLGDRQQRSPYEYPSDEPMVNTAIESFIQTDAVINRGNSGGALVNARGELVGINTAIMSPTGAYAGYGYAIPVSLVSKIMDDFKEFGVVQRGYVGIQYQPINEATRERLNVDDLYGLYVADVVKDGAAENAGIKKGDILTKIEGNTIYSSADLQERVARLRPGDKVKITYKRDGKEKDVTLTLKAQDTKKADEVSEESKRSATEIYNKLGASFVPATDKQKKDLGVNSGVVVTQVRRGGIFDYFGVEQGLVITHVNDKAVNNADEVESALGETKRNIVRVKGVSARGSVELNFPVEY